MTVLTLKDGNMPSARTFELTDDHPLGLREGIKFPPPLKLNFLN